jgi:hypothetical protein
MLFLVFKYFWTPPRGIQGQRPLIVLIKRGKEGVCPSKERGHERDNLNF